MVVRAGVTPTEVSQKACQDLGEARIVGVVLNSVDKSASVGSYSQYGYGQHASADSRKLNHIVETIPQTPHPISPGLTRISFVRSNLRPASPLPFLARPVFSPAENHALLSLRPAVR